jgi:hypothetical protein
MSEVHGTTMTPEARCMPKVSLAPKAVGRRYRTSGHMSRADRFSIKYLQDVNICNDLLTIRSG